MTTAQKAKLKEQKTEFVGLKEFRQGISTFTKRALKTNTKYIVLKRNQPIGEFRPLSKKDQMIARLEAETAEARAAYKRGEYYTMDEVMKMVGLT